MSWEWWLFVTPVVVMLLGVRVVRHKNRYRGRRRNDAGVGIFRPPELHSNCRCVVVPELRHDDLLGLTAAGRPVYHEDIGSGEGKIEPDDIITHGKVIVGVAAVPSSDPLRLYDGTDQDREGVLREFDGQPVPLGLPERAVVHTMSLDSPSFKWVGGVVPGPGYVVNPRIMAEQGWRVQHDGDQLRATWGNGDIVAVLTLI